MIVVRTTVNIKWPTCVLWNGAWLIINSGSWLGGWVGLTFSLDVQAKRKISALTGNQTRAFQLVASHFTTELSVSQYYCSACGRCTPRPLILVIKRNVNLISNEKPSLAMFTDKQGIQNVTDASFSPNCWTGVADVYRFVSFSLGEAVSSQLNHYAPTPTPAC